MDIAGILEMNAIYFAIPGFLSAQISPSLLDILYGAYFALIAAINSLYCYWKFIPGLFLKL